MVYVKSIELPVDNLYRKIPIFAKQSDYNSRYFSVKLTEKGEALTPSAFGTVSEVAIGITRGDKQKKAFRGEYDTATGVLTLPLPKWAVEVAGDKIEIDAMVSGTKGGKTYFLRSASAELYVQAAAYGEEDAEQDESVELLTGLIADVVALDTQVSTAEAAREAAEAERAQEYAVLETKLNNSLDNINAAAENAEKVNDIYAKMQITFFYDDEGYPCYTDKVNE